MIREAIRIIIQMKLNNIIEKIDFQVTIFFTMGKIVASKQIYNLVDNIKFIARNSKNIKFFLIIIGLLIL